VTIVTNPGDEQAVEMQVLMCRTALLLKSVRIPDFDFLAGK